MAKKKTAAKTAAAATTTARTPVSAALDKLEAEIIRCRGALAESVGKYNAALVAALVER